MKVAALALVLIVASAVVLIFANTLNSWVVGGLIGGLAALLISIPISLIIFSTFARRHDERLYAQMLLQQEEDLAYEEEQQQEYEEDEYYDEEKYGRVYEADAYYVEEEDEQFELPRGRRQPELRSLPPAGQSYASLSARSTPKQRTADLSQRGTSSQSSRRPTRELAHDRERGERTREFSTARQNQKQQTGHQHAARTPYTTQTLRSQQQAAARRAARQEAAQAQGRSLPASEYLSTGPTQRPTTTRHLPPQSIQLSRSRAQEEVSRANVGEDGWLRPTGNRGAKKPSNGGGERPQETQTDQLRNRDLYPATGPVRLNPETGQIARNRQVEEQSDEEETTTGNLFNPLVRRAPYLYEDDPLHEELSRHIEKPIRRRASRFLSPDADE